ncbi:MAG: acyloxyacyl hydrolase [Candidatus Omnitrophica bacterium]|nr:acyloxyacyl hydrolase [Candidatus Omnitrophota bacterium]
MNKILIILLIFVLSLPAAQGVGESYPHKKPFSAIELLTGFSSGWLKEKGHYQLTPILVAFDFDLKPLLQKINLTPKSAVQFQLEPFLSYAYNPNSNIETGASFLLKIGILPETSRLQTYFKGGVGLVYMTLHTREQSTQFNFSEQAGVGIEYLFCKNTAFIIEGRFRHMSNSSIKRPNHGINTYFILTGIAYRF